MLSVFLLIYCYAEYVKHFLLYKMGPSTTSGTPMCSIVAKRCTKGTVSQVLLVLKLI